MSISELLEKFTGLFKSKAPAKLDYDIAATAGTPASDAHGQGAEHASSASSLNETQQLPEQAATQAQEHAALGNAAASPVSAATPAATSSDVTQAAFTRADGVADADAVDTSTTYGGFPDGSGDDPSYSGFPVAEDTTSYGGYPRPDGVMGGVSDGEDGSTVADGSDGGTTTYTGFPDAEETTTYGGFPQDSSYGFDGGQASDGGEVVAVNFDGEDTGNQGGWAETAEQPQDVSNGVVASEADAPDTDPLSIQKPTD